MSQKIRTGTRLRTAQTGTGAFKEIEVKGAMERDGGIVYLVEERFYLKSKVTQRRTSYYMEWKLLAEMKSGALRAY